MTRGQRGRRLGRILLAAAAYLIFVQQPILFMAAPGSIGPMFGPPDVLGPLSLQEAVVLASLAVQVLAFVAMWRIHRADPEPDQAAWRYRAR
jgi:hypothetical protein